MAEMRKSPLNQEARAQGLFQGVVSALTASRFSPNFWARSLQNTSVTRNSRSNWFIGELCGRASAMVNPAGRGSGGALGNTPNGLSASPILANGDRQCQCYFGESPIRVPATPSAFQRRTRFCAAGYTIKLTANALCSSTNAVSISSARAMNRFSRCR